MSAPSPDPGILRESLRIPSNWRGSALADRDDWVHRLTPEEVADLESGLAHARGTGKAMAELGRDDFPLPVLAGSIAGWMKALEVGRGFVNVRGVPVADRDLDDVGWMFWGLGLHMGVAVSQNAAGDLLGHVRDTGDDPEDPSVRLYKTKVGLDFHSDGSDVVGLLCLRQGRSGGATRLVSTTALYDEVRRRRPDLVHLLYEPFYWDRQGEQAPGEPAWFQLPICRYADGRLSFFHIPWYIREAQRHADVPRLSSEQHVLLDLIDSIAADPAMHLEMQLRPGEINFLKNSTALHARTAYVDFDEPERKRHLLRLWLTAHGEWSDGDAFVQQGIPTRAGAGSDALAGNAGGRCC